MLETTGLFKPARALRLPCDSSGELGIISPDDFFSFHYPCPLADHKNYNRMIIYSSTKAGFNQDVLNNQIDSKILADFLRALGRRTGASEINSWKNSMLYMHNILTDTAIPEDAGVAIEYKIPQTSNRIDFILTGQDAQKKDTVVLVELKQWESAQATEKDAIVSTFVGGAEREVSHPSYQAWSYAALLEDFNEAIETENIGIRPCAYLHNYPNDGVLTSDFYKEHVLRAPIFFKQDVLKLQDFIKKHVKFGDNKKLMYVIENGRIRPSKNLADKLVSLLKGNQEFVLIDAQKVVYETGLNLAKKSNTNNKNVLIVDGGPGTGKSVVAVNLLVGLIDRKLNARYVTKNAAPRDVYESKLSGSLTKTRITNLFTGSGAFTACEENAFDALIVDEAHRLNGKSGMYQNLGENQIKEIIQAAPFSIFFIDENQKVTLRDIGEKEEIRRWAAQLGAKVHECALESQFRCNGSDGYLAWLDHTLQIRDTANVTLDGLNYDFRVLDDPNELRELIYEKNRINNKARLVAGYCWDWASKKDKSRSDITLPEFDFEARWNLASDGNLWILKPEAVTEVGCIHTCQGLEVDYIGVIVGNDFVVRDGRVVTNAAKRSRMDSSVKGYKKRLKEDPDLANKEMAAIIKNTYRTLMTRGGKGCFVFFVDQETRDYFKSRLEASEHVPQIGRPQVSWSTDLGERLIPDDVLEDEKKNTEYLPVYAIEAAASGFGAESNAETLGWMKIDAPVRLQKGMFVTRVTGRSMEPTIQDGALCVFKTHSAGSRAGLIVLVESLLVSDSETNQRYTVKRYTSEKEFYEDGTWRHKKITLRPDNNDFDDIVLENVVPGDFRVVAEFVKQI